MVRLDRNGSSPDFHQYHVQTKEQNVSEVLPTIIWDHGGNERLLNRGSAKMILQSLVGTQGIGGGAGSIALVLLLGRDGVTVVGHGILDGQHRLAGLEMAINDPTQPDFDANTTVSCSHHTRIWSRGDNDERMRGEG
jgi:hypothetical protein